MSEIQVAEEMQFHYEATDDNPADIATRPFGYSLNDFMENSLWWHGPSWMIHCQDTWPLKRNSQLDECQILLANQDAKEEQINYLTKIEDYSTHMRLLRVTAWIHRAARN